MEEKIAYEIHDGRVYIKVTTPTILGGSRTEGTQITLEELGSLFPYDEDLGDVVGPPYFSKTYSLLLNLPVTLREDWVAMAKENARYNLPKVEGEDRAQLEEA